MTDPIKSSSYPEWLALHLILASYHVYITGFEFLYREYNVENADNKNDQLDSNVFTMSHNTFCFLTLINIHNFGDSPVYISIIANGLPLFLMYLTFGKNKKWKDVIYFCSLTSPIILEFILYIKLIVFNN